MKNFHYNPQALIHQACPNFKMYEIFKSETASREEIDNTVGFTDLHLNNATDLVYNFLQPLRNILGVPLRISSWYRSKELEKFICWKAFRNWCETLSLNEEAWDTYLQNKSHPLGNSIDFECPGYDNDYVFELIQEEEFEFDQLIREYAEKDVPMSGWIHLSAFENHFKNRHQVLIIPPL